MLEKIGLPPKPSLKGNNWVVDATHCQGCSSQFTFIHRKHHCRRCGGIFCSSCTQLRMVLRGQGDSPVRICEPCKKLEEAARFEMRHGHKNRAGRGGPKLTPKYEDEVLNKILGTDEQEFASFGHESNIKMLSSSQRSSSSASCSNIQEAITHDEGGEILRSLSVGVTEIGSTTLSTPDELRQQALDEKKKYKTLKAEGKSEEALRAFKRGKELERQAGALDLQLRKSRRMASSSMNMNEISKTKDGTGESRKINKHSPEITKDKDDLAAELKNLGWSDLELRDADKKPVSMSLDGELSSLLGEVSQKTNTKKVAHGSDKSQVIALKKNALALKREGKLAEAKEELKRAKILEKQIEEQEFLVDTDDSADSDEELSSLIRSMDSHKQNDFSFGDVPDTNFNFDNLVDIADGLVDNFEVTDEDMDDPEMTAALESLGWTEDTRDTADNESQSVPVNREILLAEIQSLKREALNQKRAGNTAEALTLLKKAKVIEGDLGSYDSLGTNLNAHGSAIVQKDSLLQPAGILKPNLVDARKPDERKDANPILTPKSKLMIQRELLALKKRALALRREGKLDEADEELKKGKALEQQLEEMDQTSKVKVTQVNNSFKDATTSAVLDVGDEEEDVTEQDMHDPSYTSLLRNLGWKDEENGNVQSPPKENVNTPIITSDSSVTYVHTGIQLGASRRSKGEIQRELLGLKRKSLALRRQGETEEAEEVLKMAKVLEAQLSEMEAPKQEVPAEVNELQKDESSQSSVKIDADDEGAAGFSLEDNTPRLSQKRSSTEDLGRVDKVTSEKRDKIDRENVNYSIDESNSTQVMVSQNNQSSPQQELLAHKRRAVTLKREGKLVEAKEELRQAKLLERSLEDYNPKPSTSSSDVSSSNNASIRQKEQSSISAPKLSSRDRFKLQQESLSHKRQALKLRREGRTAEAEAEFELAKALETQLEELTANDPNKLSGNSAEPIDDAGVEDFLDPQLLSALKAIGIDDSPNVSGGAKRPEPVKSIAVKIDNSGEDRTQLEDRIKAEKVKAVNLKRLGKQAEAMDALRRAKMLEKKLNS